MASRNAKLKKLSRLVEGQFAYHYDTHQLGSYIYMMKPDMEVDITVKCHGTSIVIANVLTRRPIRLSVPARRHNRRAQRALRMASRQHPSSYGEKQALLRRMQRLQNSIVAAYRVEYGNVTSSRTVVKTDAINPGLGAGFYGTDLWQEYGQWLYPYIDRGLTIYGEICGYITGTNRFIQKGYDYGCAPGENYLMPYRITHTDAEGRRTEWPLQQVQQWTLNLLQQHPQLQKRLRPMTILYSGPLRGLYPDLNPARHWNESLLRRLIADRRRFGMEQPEPLCKAPVPREGIVLRIKDDALPEAFKLKTFAFLSHEAKLVDAAADGEGDLTFE